MSVLASWLVTPSLLTSPIESLIVPVNVRLPPVVRVSLSTYEPDVSFEMVKSLTKKNLENKDKVNLWYSQSWTDYITDKFQNVEKWELKVNRNYWFGGNKNVK